MTDEQINLALGIEPIPADCLPPQHVIDAAMAGPKVDPATGVIQDGTYQGMTWDEVLRQRDRYNRMF